MGGDKVDMSLDDIIATNKRGRGRGRGRGGRGRGRGMSNNRGGGGGPVRRGGRGGNLRSSSRNTPYNRPKNIPDKWEHDMYDGAGGKGNRGQRTEGLSTGTHLQISNLDFGVTDSDIKELFTEFGKLKKAIINYDGSGRSHGTADVVFEKKADALKAYNTYNGVPLDGRPMRIETVTPTVSATSNGSSFSGRRDNRGGSRGGRGNSRGGNSYRGNSRGGSRGGRGGRGRGGQRRNAPSKDDLDKELDSYIESNN